MMYRLVNYTQQCAFQADDINLIEKQQWEWAANGDDIELFVSLPTT